MTRHQKAQQLAKQYYEEMLQDNYPPKLCWSEAMHVFKMEMQK